MSYNVFVTPEQNEHFIELTRILCRPGPLEKLIRPITDQTAKIVPVEGVRYDLTDAKDAIWSRTCKPGGEPDRPGLGTVLRLKTREEFVREGDTVSIPLGFGDRASGRFVAKKTGGFTDDEVEALKTCCCLFTLALRARPFAPKPKPRNPFEEPREFL